MALSPRFRATVVVATAVLCSALPASASAGQFYEQISRTSGPYQTALVDPYAQPTALGDVGRFAGFRASFANGQWGGWVRDVRTNVTTQPGGPATKQIWGFDRAETKALIGREINGQVELRMAPLVGGGTSKLIYTSPRAPFYNAATAATGGFYYYVKAALSGDGSTVVVVDSFAGKVFKVAVGTGQITQLQTTDNTSANAWELGAQAISDDGKSVVISRPHFDNQGERGGRLYRDGFPVVELGAPGGISPDGSTVVYTPPSTVDGYAVVVRKVATGTTKTIALGGSWSTPWINANGSKLLVPGAYSDGYRVNEYDTATGAMSAAAAPAQFGGMRSPSGRFTLSGSFLIDTTLADLPGAADPISADYYLKLGATYNCRTFGKNYGTVNVTLRSQPISWAPKAIKAEVKLYVDVSLLKTATIAASSSTSVPFNGNPKYYRVIASVTDDLGRVTTGEVKYAFASCA